MKKRTLEQRIALILKYISAKEAGRDCYMIMLAINIELELDEYTANKTNPMHGNGTPLHG